MKIILFRATGMIGQGVLRECLRDEGVESVLSISRSPTGQAHPNRPKLRELIATDLFEFDVATTELQGCRAIACLAIDPERQRWNQQSLSSGELARVYGFTDLDGASPDIWQHMEATRKN
ncbi:MAG: hypothetical protein ACR2HX_21065 [Pyrinomonadaceae bacterium]